MLRKDLADALLRFLDVTLPEIVIQLKRLSGALEGLAATIDRDRSSRAR
jgi:hypothetical protein